MRSKFIWKNDCKQKDTYLNFYKNFNATKEKYSLKITANSQYAVYINGEYAASGQYADYEEYKVYDILDVSEYVKKGANELKIIVQWYGMDSSTYRCYPPCLLYELYENDNILVVSDETTTVCKNEHFLPAPLITGQLGYGYNYDSTNKHLTATNANIQEVNYPLYPRPIKKLTFESELKGYILSQGIFKENGGTDFGTRMQNAYLANISTPSKQIPSEISFRTKEDCDGLYFIIDYKEENTGLLCLHLEVEEDTDILIGFGEHLDDGRVRTSVGGRCFSVRYRAHKGENKFMCPFRRLGLRYMEFFIYSKSIKLFYAGIHPTLYPLAHIEDYDCGDALHNKIFKVCKRTLHMCMHEHYEDCPQREQALYAMDSRNQMLCGYYVFKEFEFAKASIRLMALSIRDDDFLELCSPARCVITIPSFSAIFITQCYEYLQNSNDKDFILEIIPIIERIANMFKRNIQKNGLIKCFKEKEYWNFYEWQQGLEGVILYERPDNEITYDAPLNAFVSLSFLSLSKIFNILDMNEKSELFYEAHIRINTAMEKFWNEDKQAYATFIDDNDKMWHYAELTQALTVYCNALTKTREKIVLETLKRGTLIPITCSHAIFKYEAILRNPTNKDFVLRDIEKIWGSMLFSGATTFWETRKGASDFDNAGSLCHGWSATPSYLYLKYNLNS